ncbi:hypothetical protein MVEN_00214100 [Mycena venus]|uniref:F-box domain-containing protein n=1 Tax=Mycena venus TaxID=2733690 RepID=A0A8H6YXG5_9AGAR|nr:hypothetical protein MVEN_00214100 [Mycena venus]
MPMIVFKAVLFAVTSPQSDNLIHDEVMVLAVRPVKVPFWPKKPNAILVDSTERPTLPQELIDLILDLTDKKSLKACARVARSFRPTSQKHIFSDVKLVPARSWLKKSLTLKAFSQILSKSPHLALHVRSLTLVEGTGAGSARWMRTDAFPTILSMLVNLTTISVGSDLQMDWDSFPPALIMALHATVALPSLTSVRLHNFRFGRSAELICLLRSCQNLDSLALSGVSFKRLDSTISTDSRVLDALRSGLSSLTLDPALVPLLHSVTSSFNVRTLTHLRTTVCSPELEAETQRLLDATENLTHYHIHLSHHHTDSSTISLQNLSHLRTLEIALSFEFSTAPDDFDPVNWAGSILSTSQDPSPIQHVILNVNVDERDLLSLFRLEDLEPFLLAPEMTAVRKLTVNLDSFDVDFNIYSCQRDVREALPLLDARDMLEIGLLGVS